MLRSEILPQILAYNGPDGLRGAVRQCDGRKQRIAVSDAGVLMSAHNACLLVLRPPRDGQDEHG